MTNHLPGGKPAPRPILLLQPVEPPEFAHVLKSQQGELAAIFVGRRSQGRVWAEQVWEGPREAAAQVVADQVIELIRVAQTLPEPMVLVGPTKVMLRLRQLGFTDPHLVLGVRSGHQYLEETMQLADQWRYQHTSAHPANRAVAVRVPLRVATDASVGQGSKSAAFACVDERGRQFTWRLRSSDVTYCELRAIRFALDHFSGPLRILTDSLAAVQLIENPDRQTRQPRLQALVDQIRSIAASRDITVEWVRGHSGHPLNEAADRLAMAARRARELSTPASVADRISQRIVHDLIEGAA